MMMPVEGIAVKLFLLFLLLLLCPDLLPGRLFVLQPLQLSLLLVALLPPLGDVLPQLIVHLPLLGQILGGGHPESDETGVKLSELWASSNLSSAEAKKTPAQICSQ